MYQFVNRFLSFPPFFCRKVGFSSCASLTQLPSSRKAVLPRFAQRSEVMHGHGNLVSASHEATARAGKGDDRSFGPCRIREDKGHSSCPVYTVRSVGRGANSQGMASGHGRPRALLGCLRANDHTAATVQGPVRSPALFLPPHFLTEHRDGAR